MRASYGRYYQGSTTNLFSALSPAQAVTRRFGFNPATQAYDILQQITDPRGTYVVDPDLTAPYTDQYTIGVDHELMSSLAIGASYIHKRADDFVGRVDVGSTFAPETRTDPQTGAPLTVYRRTSPAAARLVRLTNPGPDTCSYCTGGLVAALQRVPVDADETPVAELAGRWLHHDLEDGRAPLGVEPDDGVVAELGGEHVR